MKIERIILRNFQRWKRLALKLAPITSIVGESDQGKSSLIRAIYWVSQNKPRGDDFTKHGEDFVSVELITNKGTIKRFRGKGANGYRLDDKKYKAFGAAVPPQVTDTLRLQDLNFQLQHDRMFWFSLSPPDLSKELNRVVDLCVIDDSLMEVQKLFRERRQRVLTYKEDLAKAKEEVIRYSHVPDWQNRMLELEAGWKKMEGIRVEAGSLARIFNDIRRVKWIADRKVPKHDHIKAMHDQFREVVERKSALRELIQDLVNLRENIAATQHDLEMTEKKIHETMKGRCPVCGGIFNANKTV